MAIKKRFPYRAALVACNGGCIGCGACIEKCKFGAISMNEYGVAEVDEEKCIAPAVHVFSQIPHPIQLTSHCLRATAPFSLLEHFTTM